MLHHQRNTFRETVALGWIQTGTINPAQAQKLPPLASHLSPPSPPPSLKRELQNVTDMADICVKILEGWGKKFRIPRKCKMK